MIYKPIALWRHDVHWKLHFSYHSLVRNTQLKIHHLRVTYTPTCIISNLFLVFGVFKITQDYIIPTNHSLMYLTQPTTHQSLFGALSKHKHNVHMVKTRIHCTAKSTVIKNIRSNLYSLPTIFLQTLFSFPQACKLSQTVAILMTFTPLSICTDSETSHFCTVH